MAFVLTNASGIATYLRMEKQEADAMTHDDATAKVLELRKLGWGINRIAKSAGLSDDRVEKILKANGLHKERRAMSQAEAVEIADMRKAGASVIAIARSTGWSSSKIQRTLEEVRLNGWEANRTIKAEVQKPIYAQVVDLYVSGQSASSIASQLGIRKGRVAEYAKQAGIYREQDRLTADEQAEALRLRGEGMGAPEIAERIDRSPAAVRDLFVKHGLNARLVRPIRVEGSVAYVPLTQGYEAIIDAADVELVGRHNWSIVKATANNFYATGTVDGKNTPLHRFVMDADPALFVDHINHNGLDCRRSNLRQVNASLNAFNARRARSRMQAAGLPKGIYPCKGGYYAILRSDVCETVDGAVALRRAHYGRIFGDAFIDTDKLLPDVIDPETGEVLDE